MDNAGASIMLNTPYITQRMNMSNLKMNIPSTNVAPVGAVVMNQAVLNKYAAQEAASTVVCVRPMEKGVSVHQDGAAIDASQM